MSEDLIEIKCVKCGRTILVRDRWDSCPISNCQTRLAGFEDDVLDIALDELTGEMKGITSKMLLLGNRIYRRDDGDRKRD